MPQEVTAPEYVDVLDAPIVYFDVPPHTASQTEPSTLSWPREPWCRSPIRRMLRSSSLLAEDCDVAHQLQGCYGTC